MSSETNSTNNDAPKGLPPVDPPSGKFIAQLFLIPLLIVVVLVFIWWVGYYLVAEKRDPEYFLKNLDSPNSDIRWRAATDLAEVLAQPGNIDLASNPKFALDLSERLMVALDELRDEEKKTLKRIAKLSQKEDQDKEWRKLRPLQDHVMYLISALGNFVIPAGAPVLCDVATQDEDFEGRRLKTVIQQKRFAVYALALLGKNVERFHDIPEEKQEEILDQLSLEMDSEALRGKWARATYNFLAKDQPMKVDEALAVCADPEKSKDIFLRELVAVTLNHWEGDQIEPTLEKLAHDEGKGILIKVEEGD